MRVLKITGLGLAGLVVLVIAASYALPRQVEVERSIVIAAEPDEIFPYLNSLENFNAWSPWDERDPNIVYEFTGPSSGVGNKSEWSSDHPQVGNGSQVITESREDEFIRTELDFGADGTASAFFRLTRVDTGTEVIWGLDSDMGNSPIGRYIGLMMDSWIGSDYETGLVRLKGLVENGD